VKIELKDTSSTQKEMTLTIEADVASKDYQKILTGLRQYASVPGFRKGKAPLNMVERLYGENIKEEFYNQKLKDYYKKALEEKKIKPINQGEATKVEWEKGKELVVVFKFEVMPDIEIKKYSALEIPYEKIEFKQQMVDVTLEDYRQKVANEIDTDSPSEKNDKITAKITFLNDDASDGKTIERTFLLGDNSYSENFNNNLTGAKVGDQIKTKLFSQGQEIKDNEIESKFYESTARVEIISIKSKQLPDLNDEFAKDLEYDSLSDMKKKIAAELKLKIKQENEQRLRSAIIGKLIEENPFDLPSSIIHSYAESMAKPYADNYKVSMEKIVPMYYKMAEYNIKSHYIMEKLLKIKNVEISEQEKAELISEAALNLNMELEKYKKMYANQIQSEEFTRAAKEKKLIKMIADDSKFVPYPKEEIKADSPDKK